jgi:hypothetical protein
MKMKIVLLVLMMGITFTGVKIASAETGGDLPDASSPFWTVLQDASMTSPDDTDCDGLATTALTTGGVPDAAIQAASMCDGITLIKTNMQTGMATDGVTTNLFSAPDWHHVSNLYFDHPNGKIEFTQEVDFMSRSFMVFMSEFTERMSIDQNEIGLDADIVVGLKNNAAILTMKNVSDFDIPIILVDGEEDNGGVISGLTYDAVNNTIVFNAAHFTTFKAVDENSLNKPKIDKVKAEKFTDKKGKEKIKLTLQGKRFKNNSEVKLGSKKAYKVTKKSNKKIIAYFSVSDLQKLGKNKLKITVENNSNAKREYKKKLNLGEILSAKN